MTDVITKSDGVQGDITSCRVENVVKKIDRSSAFSLTEHTTYMTYDVCSKEIIDEYTVETFTGLCGVMLMIAAAVAGVILFYWACTHD